MEEDEEMKRRKEMTKWSEEVKGGEMEELKKWRNEEMKKRRNERSKEIKEEMKKWRNEERSAKEPHDVWELAWKVNNMWSTELWSLEGKT